MKDEKYIFTVAVVFSQTLFCLVFLADEDKNLFDLSGFQRNLESFYSLLFYQTITFITPLLCKVNLVHQNFIR